jgi:hypothetical protein
MSETSARILVHACPYHSYSLICDYIEIWRMCVDMVFGSIIGCYSKIVWVICLNIFSGLACYISESPKPLKFVLNCDLYFRTISMIRCICKGRPYLESFKTWTSFRDNIVSSKVTSYYILNRGQWMKSKDRLFPKVTHRSYKLTTLYRTFF